MKYEQLQNESISLKMKLKEEEMLRKKAEEEQRRIARELVKVQIREIWLSRRLFTQTSSFVDGEEMVRQLFKIKRHTQESNF